MGATGLWNKSQVAGMLTLQHRLHTHADAITRRRTWINGLCDLINAAAGVLLVHEVAGASPGKLLTADAVGIDGDGVLLTRALLTGDTPDPAALKLARKVIRRRPKTATRAQLIGDGDWYRHDHVRTVRQPLGLDDAVYSARHLDNGTIACIALLRPWNHRKRFARAEKETVDLLHGHCGWLYHDDAPTASADVLGLSPRERQTLWKLLDGRSEKQIAREMNVSPNTIHHYVKSIYRQLGVSSRGELSAKWLGRNKPEE